MQKTEILIFHSESYPIRKLFKKKIKINCARETLRYVKLIRNFF